MKTETFGRLTAITLDRDFPHMSGMLEELGIDKLFVAFNNEAHKAGVKGAFIAKDSKRTYAFGDPRNPSHPLNRWKHSHWGSIVDGSLVDVEGTPSKGDVLVLTESLEKAQELSA